MALTISIIMPSFNQVRFLSEAIGSVLSQDGPLDVELIVIDGASTDGSVQLLQSIRDSRLHWISEPDKGQSDALCKGLHRVRGEIVGWLNSDDRYRPGALSKVAHAFSANDKAQWIVGRCGIMNGTGHPVRRPISMYKDFHLHRYSFSRLLRQNFISQPAVFWRREFGKIVGDPDVSLHHAMDYDMWLRMAQRSEPMVVNDLLSDFRVHTSSKTTTAFRRGFREHLMVAKRHGKGYAWSLLMNRISTAGIVSVYQLMSLLGR